MAFTKQMEVGKGMRRGSGRQIWIISSHERPDTPWGKSDQWGPSAEPVPLWRLGDSALHRITQNDMVRHHSIQFSLLFPKENNNYKIQDSSKLVYVSFYFSIMGPVCLQPTSTLSVGNLIFISHHTFYSASVNLKWDGYCREWIVEGQKRETLRITHIIPSVLFRHMIQKHNCKWESVEWKPATSKLTPSVWSNLALRTQAN